MFWYGAEAFEREVAAFEQLRPSLLKQYAGKYVAIYQGEVVASGDEKLALLDQVRERFGHAVCYIEKVTPESPRTVRMPSVRVVRPCSPITRMLLLFPSVFHPIRVYRIWHGSSYLYVLSS